MTVHSKTKLVILSWTWFGIVDLVVILRLVARYMHLGCSIKSLQLDDWLMFPILAAYATLIRFLNIAAVTPTNLFTPGTDPSTFSPKDYATRVWGSKVVVIIEQCQSFVLWSSKAALLIMYLRITQFQTERKYVIALAWYVGGSYLIMEILYFSVWCRPFRDYWSVPPSDEQCATNSHHSITNAVFNLSTDVLLICIVLPIFLKTMMPLRKKLAICAVFGLGVFNIAAAIVNKYNAFANTLGTEWTKWYVYECSTAIMVANLPFLYTLIRRIFGPLPLDGTAKKRPERPSASKDHGHADSWPRRLTAPSAVLSAYYGARCGTHRSAY
ncbi:hypothetical protein K461DRAFT_327886 [Myriangium duriaei CBS 260.36]|uniref:Rhodopsin domain-containing protein n=1 Tax=Myriangium duriaei CBS 260.36 TaxID=1168546 RepID=A0A9P4J4R0_9PEZI|nr:hypothetical protein K461DRAFT_327886 [Myriangium duriaei CBS 260.36]